MKKVTAIVLTTALAATLGVSAFAENQDVKATYVKGAAADPVQNYSLSWGSLEYTYTDESEGTWIPETHTFENKDAAAWSCSTNANVISLVNHSNTAISAELTYTPAAGFEAIAGSFDKATLPLATAVGTTVIGAPSTTAKLTLSGALDKAVTTPTAVGTVTITITNAD